MRILPPLQLYFASSAFGMLPSYDAVAQMPLIPTTLDRVNLSIGLNLVFFERKPKAVKSGETLKIKNMKTKKQPSN
jgi:hypothetical protein